MQKKSSQKNKRKQVGDIVVFVGEKYIIPQIHNYEEKINGKKLIIKEVIKCTCHDHNMDYLIFEGIEGHFRSGFFEIKGKEEE